MEGDEPAKGGPDDGRVVTVLLDVLGVEVRVGAIREWRNPDIDQVDALARLALAGPAQGVDRQAPGAVRPHGRAARHVRPRRDRHRRGDRRGDTAAAGRAPVCRRAVADASLSRRLGQSRCAGSPTNGNSSAIQEVADLHDLAALDVEHLQRPRGEATGRVDLVLAERRPAVHHAGGEHARALARRTLAEVPLADLVAVLQPQLERRHRHRGVLTEERDERRDVVPLERLHVAGEDLLLRRVDDRRPRGLRVDVGERGPGPLQRRVHRRHGRVEQLGDLGGLPPQHLSKDQHGALARRQRLQGGDEGEPDRVLGRSHLGRVAAVGHHLRVGDGQDPRLLAEARRQRRCRPPTPGRGPSDGPGAGGR